MAKRVTIEVLAMIAIGLLLGLLGPFGTFAAAPGARILSWIVWLLTGYIFFRPTGIVAGWLCEATGLPRPAGTLLALVVASFPLTLAITMLAMKLSLGEALRWDGFWTMYFYIWVISAVVSVAMSALFGRQAGAKASHAAPVTLAAPPPPAVSPSTPAPAATPPDGFETRLPPGFGSLLALKGEDHYVRAIGAHREELILQRLGDAIAELPAGTGLRVHRSWWVARAAVARVERDGRTARLILTNGTEAPVSRDNMARLREAGWL